MGLRAGWPNILHIHQPTCKRHIMLVFEEVCSSICTHLSRCLPLGHPQCASDWWQAAIEAWLLGFAPALSSISTSNDCPSSVVLLGSPATAPGPLICLNMVDGPTTLGKRDSQTLKTITVQYTVCQGLDESLLCNNMATQQRKDIPRLTLKIACPSPQPMHYRQHSSLIGRTLTPGMRTAGPGPASHRGSAPLQLYCSPPAGQLPVASPLACALHCARA